MGLLQRGALHVWVSRGASYKPPRLMHAPYDRWGPTEQQELLARRLGLLRYLLRSPCYNVVARWGRARRHVADCPQHEPTRESGCLMYRDRGGADAGLRRLGSHVAL